MTRNSKRSIIDIATTIIVVLAYIYYVTNIHAPEASNLKAWALLILSFIGLCIIALILIQIAFHIIYAIGVSIKEKDTDDENINSIVSDSMVEDEMDKLISLKSIKVSYFFAGLAFVLALISLAVGFSVITAIHIVLSGFVLGNIIEGCFTIYHYEIGVHHG